VNVKKSTIIDADEGLFVTRDIKAGELISFYSGFINTCESTNTFASLDRRRGLDNIEMNKNSLAIFDIYQPDKKFQNLCVFVPEEYSSTGHYRATLGHKANHSPESNARYTLFTAHPVFGSIMSIIALEDLKKGDEVLCNYGYKDKNIYQKLKIDSDSGNVCNVGSVPSEP